MRTSVKYKLKFPLDFKERLFEWNKSFEVSVWLDSNQYSENYSSFDVCLAVEEFTSIKTDYNTAIEKLKEYQSYTRDYIFGYLTYDVKNDIENLKSSNPDGLGFSDIYFFQPQKIITIKGDTVTFDYLLMVDDEIEYDYQQICDLEILPSKIKSTKVEINSRISKSTYLQKIKEVLRHIQEGNIYEANFCQEFFAEGAVIDPYQIYKDLNVISEPPFATFMRIEDRYVISASPERYIRKKGTKIISQPIKGTAKRYVLESEDKESARLLKESKKEQSENIMIVDLVRNDLSKSAKKSSVKVEELCELYSFKQVHQLISTVTSELKDSIHPVDVIRDTFPMGSMTGAPKISAMKIMEELEDSKRGLYSGAIGYFTPDGNFDFNVVIRTILYNFENRYVSYSVGGAITAKSVAESEYEECLLKAKALKQVLTKNN